MKQEKIFIDQNIWFSLFVILHYHTSVKNMLSFVWKHFYFYLPIDDSIPMKYSKLSHAPFPNKKKFSSIVTFSFFLQQLTIHVTRTYNQQKIKHISSVYLYVYSAMISYTDDDIVKPRTSRLYSMQTKRKKEKSPSSASSNKQNTL